MILCEVEDYHYSLGLSPYRGDVRPSECVCPELTVFVRFFFGVRQVAGGDWFFHENVIQSREWWRRSEYVGVGIRESLNRLIPSQKLVKGDLDIPSPNGKRKWQGEGRTSPQGCNESVCRGISNRVGV